MKYLSWSCVDCSVKGSPSAVALFSAHFSTFSAIQVKRSVFSTPTALFRPWAPRLHMIHAFALQPCLMSYHSHLWVNLCKVDYYFDCHYFVRMGFHLCIVHCRPFTSILANRVYSHPIPFHSQPWLSRAWKVHQWLWSNSCIAFHTQGWSGPGPQGTSVASWLGSWSPCNSVALFDLGATPLRLLTDFASLKIRDRCRQAKVLSHHSELSAPILCANLLAFCTCWDTWCSLGASIACPFVIYY